MKRASFIITKDVATPYVINTTMPHKPRIIRYKRYKPGDMVTGVVHMKGDKPDFILVKGRLVIPVTAVKELVTQEILSNADGKGLKDLKKYVKTGNSGIKYADAAIIGAVLGFGLTWIAEKQTWISVPETKNKLIGAAIGAGLFAYIVYRLRNSKK